MQIEDEVIVDSIDGGKLTLFGAAKDLGFFFWLFSAVVGAPSVLSLFKTVFVDLSFSGFLETLIAGYRELLDTIAGLLEPIATAVIHRFGTWLDFELELQPHWQPLFVLISIFITANIRTLWNDGYAKTTILFGAVMVLFALIGSWIAGIIAPQAPWWAQGDCGVGAHFFSFLRALRFLCHGDGAVWISPTLSQTPCLLSRSGGFSRIAWVCPGRNDLADPADRRACRPFGSVLRYVPLWPLLDDLRLSKERSVGDPVRVTHDRRVHFCNLRDHCRNRIGVHLRWAHEAEVHALIASD